MVIQEASRGKSGDHERGRLTVTVYDEDAGGPPLTFEAGPGEKISKVIRELYEALGVSESETDRLICHATGESVKAHREMHLKEYADGLCGDLTWTYSRDTGGA
jgi:hypothetical protein